MRARFRPCARGSGETASPELDASGGLNLVVTDKKHFGAGLLNATGSSAHLELLGEFARDKGLTLKSDGLYRGKKLIASANEQDIYEALGLQFIEPELREGRDEIQKAAKNTLPELVHDKDLRGILHCHTTAPDGTETLETMAEGTRQRGFEYFGVADHSQSAHYAGGLSLEENSDQHREADRLNKRYGKSFRILKGIEADILGDGSLDYLDRVLSKFDFVIASVHSRFKMPKKEQTERIIKAISESSHDHSRAHNRTPANAPTRRIRDRHRQRSQGLRGIRRRRRDQCSSVAA